MSELNEKLLEIKRQKDTYIIPENIKKDITVYGVTGTLESGGSTINNQDKTVTQNGTYTADSGYTGLGTVTVNVPSSGDVPVKLFHSIQEMQQDPNPQEGDLAVVQDDTDVPYDGISDVTSLYFPRIVVLSAASDAYASGHGDMMVDLSISSTDARFDFDNWQSGVSYNISYESQDGLTYVRTDPEDQVITLSEDGIDLALMRWDNVFGNFMRITNKAFEGFFEYNTIDATNTILVKPVSDYSWDDEESKVVQVNNTSFNLSLDTLHSCIDSVIAGITSTNILYRNNGTYYLLLKPDTYPNMIYITLDGHIVGQAYGSATSYSVNEYILDLTNKTVTLNQTRTIPRSGSATYFDTGIISDILPIAVFNGYIGVETDPSYAYVSRTVTGSRTNIRNEYGKDTAYHHNAPNLTLNNANQILTGVVGYGENGIIIGDGTIYNNLSPEELFKKSFNWPLQVKDDNGSLYNIDKHFNTISSYRNNAPVYLEKTDPLDTDTDYVVGVAEYVYLLSDVAKLCGYNVTDGGIWRNGEYFITTCTLEDGSYHIYKINSTFTQIIQDITPTITATRVRGNCYGYGGIFYFEGSSSYENYIIDINGNIVKLGINISTSVPHTTVDGFIAFSTFNGNAYLYDYRNQTVYNLGNLGITGNGAVNKIFDFEDYLYVAATISNYNPTSYNLKWYKYDKSAKTVTSTGAYNNNGSNISFNNRQPYVDYQTCIIQNDLIIDYMDGSYIRTTSTKPYGGYINVFTDNTKQYKFLAKLDNGVVTIGDTTGTNVINASKISGNISLTNLVISSSSSGSAIIDATLTPIDVSISKSGSSPIVIDRYETDTYKKIRYNFSSVKDTTGSTRYPDYWRTLETYESCGYGQCCRFRWYHFKESDNPEYMLMITGFTEKSNIAPSTALLLLNVPNYLNFLD